MHLHLVTLHAMPSAQAVPLAAAFLKAFLDARPAPARPATVSCAEFFSGTPLEEVCDAILAQRPDLVGLPLYETMSLLGGEGYPIRFGWLNAT